MSRSLSHSELTGHVTLLSMRMKEVERGYRNLRKEMKVLLSENRRLQSENSELQSRNASLEARNAELESRLAEMVQKLSAYEEVVKDSSNRKS